MIIAAILLASLGIVVLYSSSSTLATQQAVFCLVGIVLFFLISRFDYRALKPLIVPLYVIVLVFLVIVFLLGVETRGSVRWIPLWIFNFQPSELAKPVLILSLAYFWVKRETSWLNILKSGLITLPFILLIFRQPDLGTALTIGFIWLSLLFAANVSILKLGVISLIGLMGTPLIWMLMHSYQKQRILSFLFPTQDPLGRGFHVIQSMIAVGSGGLFGRGLGRGTQSRLQFLPEFRTDFIFSFISEELGLMGGLIVLSFYGIIFYLCYRVLSRVSERLGGLIVMGVMGMLFFQIVVNIGMNTGIMPVTGITLPLLSYGGSSVISIFICLGLVGSVRTFGVVKMKIRQFSLLEE